jgi:hypothetical protein
MNAHFEKRNFDCSPVADGKVMDAGPINFNPLPFGASILNVTG